MSAMLVHQSTFLSVPLEIRQQIYTLLGLVRDCPINIENEGQRWYNLRSAKSNYENRLFKQYSQRSIRSWQHNSCAKSHKRSYSTLCPEGGDCVHELLPIYLLLVSKQIYSEAIHLLYSENIILLGSKALTRTQMMPISSIRMLEVQLTECSCISDHHCSNLASFQNFHNCEKCHFYCKRGKGEPLSLCQPHFAELIQHWRSFCAQLKSAGRLCSLTLICDCKDIITATKIVQCLEDLHVLQFASVRLGQTPATKLGALAEHSVRKLLGRETSPVFSHFLRLPRELQEMILYRTDLVANDYVSCNEPFANRDYHGSLKLGNTNRGLRLLYGVIVDCCLQCSKSAEVCACPARHAAYTSRICQCWTFPSSIFLVSRAVNHMAKMVFYSNNKFVLWEPGDKRWNRADLYLKESTEIIRAIPLIYTASFCWLRLLFKDFASADGLLETDQYKAWITFTTIIKQWPVVENLTIELDFSHKPALCLENDDHYLSIENLDILQTKQSCRNIAHLFKLNEDRHYKDFFVRLAYQVRSMEEDWARWHLERELEKSVMGIEDYDAASRGKFRDSKWYHNETVQPKIYLQAEYCWFADDPRFFIPFVDEDQARDHSIAFKAAQEPRISLW